MEIWVNERTARARAHARNYCISLDTQIPLGQAVRQQLKPQGKSRMDDQVQLTGCYFMPETFSFDLFLSADKPFFKVDGRITKADRTELIWI